jgi:hypothetical protein
MDLTLFPPFLFLRLIEVPPPEHCCWGWEVLKVRYEEKKVALHLTNFSED